MVVKQRMGWCITDTHEGRIPLDMLNAAKAFRFLWGSSKGFRDEGWGLWGISTCLSFRVRDTGHQV